MSNWLYNTTEPREHAPKAMAGKVTSVLAAVSFLASLQCTMQFFAHAFQYQSALGARLRHLPARWSIVRCASRRYAAYTNAMMRSGYVRTLAARGLIPLIIARTVLASSVRNNPYLHGSARWADLKDIQVSGLLARWRTLWEVTTGKAPTAAAGVYVGAWLDKRGKQHYLRHNGPEHDLCYVPTRSENNRAGKKLIRRSWIGRGTQQNRRNNQSLSVQEHLTIAKIAVRLKIKPKTITNEMAAGMMDAGVT